MSDYLTEERSSLGMEADDNYISGYACLFDAPYKVFGDFYEDVKRSAFDGLDLSECVATMDHEKSRLLGRVNNKTLELKLDDRGLFYRIPIDKSDPDHMATVAKIKRGDYKHSSWRFDVAQSHYGYRNGNKTRTITKLAKLRDVCPVWDAANKNTSCSVSRSVITMGWETFIRLEKWREKNK